MDKFVKKTKPKTRHDTIHESEIFNENDHMNMEVEPSASPTDPETVASSSTHSFPSPSTTSTKDVEAPIHAIFDAKYFTIKPKDSKENKNIDKKNKGKLCVTCICSTCKAEIKGAYNAVTNFYKHYKVGYISNSYDL